MDEKNKLEINWVVFREIISFVIILLFKLYDVT